MDPEQVQTIIFMDFEVAGRNLKTELVDGLEPLCSEKMDPTEQLRKLVASDATHSWQVPHIAEMSFVSLPRRLFLEAAESMQFKQDRMEDYRQQDSSLRIDVAANVFTSQLNPGLSEQDWAIYESRRASMRLRRSELTEKCSFAEEWPTVQHLLRVAPKPACLVAHNGIHFDYRILLHELGRERLLDRFPIPDGVFFADSYLIFKRIEEEHHRRVQTTLENMNWELILQIPMNSQCQKTIHSQDEVDLGSEEEEEQEIQILMADCPLANKPISPTLSNSSAIIASDGLLETEKEDNRGRKDKEEDEVTFVACKTGNGPVGTQSGLPKIKRVRQDIWSENNKGTMRKTRDLDGNHPFKYFQTRDWCPAKRKRIPARLFEKDENGRWSFPPKNSNRFLTQPGNFKLENMHQMLIGSAHRAHRAQADSEAMLQVSLAYGNDFLRYMDRGKASFPKC